MPADLERRVGVATATPAGEPLPAHTEAAVEELLAALERGDLRAAERDADGTWRAVPWVKQGILLAFRVGRVVDMTPAGGARGAFQFFDKHTVPPLALRLESQVRVVPGGSTIRRGAYVAPGVVCMPPMYINVGARVGAGTMVDSHALVGSCAQIGERVHLSAAAQVGGVLEPVNAAPVVIEDDVIVGGNSGVYEGTVVPPPRRARRRGGAHPRDAGLRPRARDRVPRLGRTAARDPGGRPSSSRGRGGVRGEWAEGEGLSVQTP
jgi:2,3,4,5-tetrahydropyridine-2-carboxylate N-succinyltransferase